VPKFQHHKSYAPDSRICLRFWKKIIQENTNVVVFPLAFYIAVQQPFKAQQQQQQQQQQRQ